MGQNRKAALDVVPAADGMHPHKMHETQRRPDHNSKRRHSLYRQLSPRALTASCNNPGFPALISSSRVLDVQPQMRMPTRTSLQEKGQPTGSSSLHLTNTDSVVSEDNSARSTTRSLAPQRIVLPERVLMGGLALTSLTTTINEPHPNQKCPHDFSSQGCCPPHWETCPCRDTSTSLWTNFHCKPHHSARLQCAQRLAQAQSMLTSPLQSTSTTKPGPKERTRSSLATILQHFRCVNPQPSPPTVS